MPQAYLSGHYRLEEIATYVGYSYVTVQNSPPLQLNFDRLEISVNNDQMKVLILVSHSH